MSASSSPVCFLNTFQSGEIIQRESSAITRVVVENLTMKLFFSGNKKCDSVQFMYRNLRYRYGLSIFLLTTTCTDLSIFIPLLRSQMLFQGYRDILIIVYILRLCTLAGLPNFFMSESPKTAAQLVVRAPL